ncbi:MAG: bacillithiol biosynthesis deacetylase BshB1 [Nitrospinae bacterium]|nr:bacillithiol biosynthesis deacetylase BshB1 [Nitrospinota bacterium]
MTEILVVGTHPDDAELGIGGAIAAWGAKGYAVSILDLTNGEPTPFGDPATRGAEAAAAAQILGVKRRITLDLPNRELVDTPASRRKVAEVYRTLRPELVFIQGSVDAHPDHIEGASLAWKARFDAKLTKTDMAGDPFYPKKVIRYLASHLPHVVQPTFVFDISATFDRKLAAALCYRSQFEAAGRRDWLVEKLTLMARYYGDLIGVRYGEAFMSEETLGLSDLRDITR